MDTPPRRRSSILVASAERANRRGSVENRTPAGTHAKAARDGACSAADLALLDELVPLGRRVFAVIDPAGAGAVSSQHAVALYERLGEFDSSVSVSAWQEIVREVESVHGDGIGSSSGDGVVTRARWMAWIRHLRDTTHAPYQIHDMHDELQGIVNNLRRASLIISLDAAGAAALIARIAREARSSSLGDVLEHIAEEGGGVEEVPLDAFVVDGYLSCRTKGVRRVVRRRRYALSSEGQLYCFHPLAAPQEGSEARKHIARANVAFVAAALDAEAAFIVTRTRACEGADADDDDAWRERFVCDDSEELGTWLLAMRRVGWVVEGPIPGGDQEGGESSPLEWRRTKRGRRGRGGVPDGWKDPCCDEGTSCIVA